MEEFIDPVEDNVYALNGGEKYSIYVLSDKHSDEEYELTIMQDNWAYTPYGAEAQFGNITIKSLKGNVVNGIVTNYVNYKEGSIYIAKDYNDITEEQFKEACGTHADKLLQCLETSSNNFALAGDIATLTGLVLLDDNAVALLNLLPVNDAPGKIGIVATLVSGFVLFNSKINEFKKYELKNALINGKYNIKMYIEHTKYVDSVTHKECEGYNVHWYPWFEGEYGYSNKYFYLAPGNNIVNIKIDEMKTYYRYESVKPVDYYKPVKKDGEWKLEKITDYTEINSISCDYNTCYDFCEPAVS